MYWNGCKFHVSTVYNTHSAKCYSLSIYFCVVLRVSNITKYARLYTSIRKIQCNKAQSNVLYLRTRWHKLAKFKRSKAWTWTSMLSVWWLVWMIVSCLVEGKSMRLIRTMSKSKVNEFKLLKWIRFMMWCFFFHSLALAPRSCVYGFLGNCVCACLFLFRCVCTNLGRTCTQKGREKHFPIMKENSIAKQKLKQNEESHLCCHGYQALFNPLFLIRFFWMGWRKSIAILCTQFPNELIENVI